MSITNYKNLIKGQRYLFHKESSDGSSVVFSANFHDITSKNTLKVTKLVQPGKPVFEGEKNCVWSMPLDWITKIETLNSTTYEETVFPEEIVLEMENFN